MLTWSVRLATPLTAPAVTAIQTVMRVVGSRLKLNIRSLSSRTITASSSEAGSFQKIRATAAARPRVKRKNCRTSVQIMAFMPPTRV